MKYSNEKKNHKYNYKTMHLYNIHKYNYTDCTHHSKTSISKKGKEKKNNK